MMTKNESEHRLNHDEEKADEPDVPKKLCGKRSLLHSGKNETGLVHSKKELNSQQPQGKKIRPPFSAGQYRRGFSMESGIKMHEDTVLWRREPGLDGMT